ncbi:TetR/AcrR family transcriptional regulator [Numidum massiliense]|uniref:TetR/AcrR family transcriptional regulator n=1 Tax=Numidum massiliense TaxID=1522315 RepID=UPI0006D58A48|nr:TetR/AcrR family transcriptional regulator [Numidum massiliense]
MAKRTGEKYEAIIDAAVRVIARNGYHNAQVSKIAREANVADGTIYLYFENKNDVLISLFKEKMGRFIQDMERTMMTIANPAEQLKTLITSHFRYLETDGELAIVTQIELRQSNPEVREEIGQILKSYLGVIDEIVRAGQRIGMFRQNLDVKLARKMIFGTLDEIVTSWIMNGCKYSITEMTEPVHDLFLQGLKA